MKATIRALLVGALFLSSTLPAVSQTSPTLTFTLETTTGADKRSVVPKLTWATSPAATSCSASGSSTWTGSKPATGSLTLAAVGVSTTYALVCNWPGITKVALAWTAPTSNTDGTPLTDLAGFRVMYGKGNSESGLDSSVYTESPTVTSWTSPDLAPGTWYFGVKAYNALGLESALSNIVSKVATAGATENRSLALSIKFPNAPTVQ